MSRSLKLQVTINEIEFPDLFNHLNEIPSARQRSNVLKRVADIQCGKLILNTDEKGRDKTQEQKTTSIYGSKQLAKQATDLAFLRSGPTTKHLSLQNTRTRLIQPSIENDDDMSDLDKLVTNAVSN